MGRASRSKKGRRAPPPDATTGSGTADRTMRFGYYFVAYVDLLGQSDALEELRTIPHALEHRAEAFAVVRKTAIHVKAIRESFRDFFRQATRVTRQLPPGVTQQQRDEYVRFRAVDVKQVGFSDTFVIAVPLLQGEFGSAQAAMGVWSALYGIAGISLSSLATKIPLRAGLAVERAIDFYPQEVYGLALPDAYHLESKVADYPRAVVGPGLLSYISYLEQRPQNTGWDRYAVDTARACRDLICEAPDDGVPMLHMLSPAVLQLGAPLTRPAAAAYEFAKAERKRFEAAGDEKLRRRYERLVGYFNAYGYTD